MKFKIGDKVKIVNCEHSQDAKTRVGVISIIKDYGGEHNGMNWCHLLDGNLSIYEKELELVNNINNMNIIDKIKLARMNEPEKTLVKAELMNLDGSLTAEGKEVLNDILVQTYKEKIKTEYALPIIEDKEKNKTA